jgi:hypothetical protein
MSPAQESNGASMASVEEGVPAESIESNSNARSTMRQQLSSRLSAISKKYDVDGDGKLDAAEQAMRDMDSQNLGYLTNDKVYTIFQEQLRMQKQLLMAKRIIIFCAVLLIILAAANVGVSFAAANLAKDTSTKNNVLVVKENGQVVQTDNHQYTFEATPDESSRRLQFNVTSDCSNGICKLGPSSETALEVLRLCELRLPVEVVLKSSLFSTTGELETLSIFKVCNSNIGVKEEITKNIQRDGSVTDYNITRTDAGFGFKSVAPASTEPWLFSELF